MTREDFAIWERVALRFEELHWRRRPDLWPPGDVLIRAAAIADTRDGFMMDRARLARWPLEFDWQSPERLARLAEPLTFVPLGGRYSDRIAWGGRLPIPIARAGQSR